MLVLDAVPRRFQRNFRVMHDLQDLETATAQITRKVGLDKKTNVTKHKPQLHHSTNRLPHPPQRHPEAPPQPPKNQTQTIPPLNAKDAPVSQIIRHSAKELRQNIYRNMFDHID